MSAFNGGVWEYVSKRRAQKCDPKTAIVMTVREIINSGHDNTHYYSHLTEEHDFTAWELSPPKGPRL